MRPSSIILFERLFLGSVFLSIVNMFWHYQLLRAYTISQGGSPSGPIFGIIFVLIMSIPFWFFIARRASNVAKWILVSLTALGLLSILSTYAKSAAISPTYGWVSLAVALVQGAAVALLFRRDAVDWLKSGGRNITVNPRVFD